MKLLWQVLKFGIVGVVAALVDVGVLTLSHEVFGISVMLSSAIGFFTSVVVNYLLSMRFVFKGQEGNKFLEFIIFTLLCIGGLGINQLIMWLGAELMGIYYLYAKVFSMLFVMVYNFVTRKVFLEKK